jgi:dihydroorotate dehydrogenase (fumarate)
MSAAIALTSGSIEFDRGSHTSSRVRANLLPLRAAYVGMMTSVLHDLVQWLESHDYDSVEQMIGSMSQQNVAEPAAFERANYLKVLGSYTLRN